MGQRRVKDRFTHWAALALLSGASAVIGWSAWTPEDARQSRETYEARHRACERLNAEVVRLRLAIVHGGASPLEREGFERVNAEWLELYQWCSAWEIAHDVRSIEDVGDEMAEASAITVDASADDDAERGDG